MKLKNKKTGQLGNFIINKDHFECCDLDYVPEYSSLAELNEEWEDYEEPKDFWFIDDEGYVEVESEEYEKHLDEMKSIGNYFATKEEAEKVVEKLKAWKRLKDKGVEISYWAIASGYEIRIFCRYSGPEIKEDLDLLFGGEE